MDAKLIERLDKQRYWAVLLETFGLLLGFAQSVWGYLLQGATPSWYTPISSGYGGFFGYGPSYINIALLILIAGGIWYGIIYLRVRRNERLHSALYNEMYRQHKRSYQRWAMWAMMGVAVVTTICVPVRYPHIIITEIIVMVGFLTMKISWLVYNRR